ncbi:MAG TPA: flagellar hook-associated protein FlgK, partial [Firmicutes bacterium]|nr:flagellar hook-associated protein FlgK [Bacillota bacterium]
MGSTFGSFEIGRRGIHAMQKGAQVTGQNIANANTEGYTRQIMNLKALVPPAVAGVETPPGYGVNVSAIKRIKSEFYDSQIRQSLSQRDYWSQLGETLTALEVIFLEPGDTGINTYLSEFFDAWQELSTNPESYAARV